jgi:ABC-2 type transport system ATP-binding protein
MISVDNISKYFGDNTAVDNLSFSIKDGEIVGLLGPNGAGKTTTMRIMSGFLSPDEGNVVINDVSVIENPIQAQEMIGYLPENNPLYKDMLVSEFLNFSLDLKKLEGEQRTKALDFAVKAVNIQDVFYRPINELSKGYKQRVGIAAALLHKPKILIMDEPTEGLDPNQRTEIRSLIKKLAKDHTIIISTHVMQEVEAICSRMIVINKGKKAADGSVDDLSRGASNEILIHAEIEGNKVKEALQELKKVKKLNIEKSKGNKVNVELVTDVRYAVQPDLAKLAKDNDWIIWQLKEHKLDLEDVFKQLTVDAPKAEKKSKSMGEEKE